MHFMSFLLDLCLWVLLGVGVGHIAYSFDQTKKIGRIRTQLMYVIVSCLTGFFSTLVFALPNEGIAYDFLLNVLSSMFVFSFIRYVEFRKMILRLANFHKIIINTNFSFLRRGVGLLSRFPMRHRDDNYIGVSRKILNVSKPV